MKQDRARNGVGRRIGTPIIRGGDNLPKRPRGLILSARGPTMISKIGVPFLILLALCLAPPLGAATDRKLTSFTGIELKDRDPKEDVIFVVAGDNRPTAKGAPLPRVAETILSEIGLIRPDFVLWTGDTVYGYCDTRDELEAEYQRFREAAAPLVGFVPFYNSPGNHEIHSTQTAQRLRAEARPALLGGPRSRGQEPLLRGGLRQPLRPALRVWRLRRDPLHRPQHRRAGRRGCDLRPAARLAEGGPEEQRERAGHLPVHPHRVLPVPLHRSGGGPGTSDGRSRLELQDLFARYPVAAVFSGTSTSSGTSPRRSTALSTTSWPAAPARRSTRLPTAAASRIT